MIKLWISVFLAHSLGVLFVGLHPIGLRLDLLKSEQKIVCDRDLDSRSQYPTYLDGVIRHDTFTPSHSFV
jgi:hypothetical protein